MSCDDGNIMLRAFASEYNGDGFHRCIVHKKMESGLPLQPRHPLRRVTLAQIAGRYPLDAIAAEVLGADWKRARVGFGRMRHTVSDDSELLPLPHIVEHHTPKTVSE